MLQLENISKSYGDTVALHPLSLTVAEGETLSVIGPSGCGKSTLIRTVVGLVTPDSGQVRISGTRLTADNAVQLRRKMGYVIQEGGLFDHLTARGNVEIVARYLDWEEERRRKRISELAELCHLPETVLDRVPNELSGGQRQRVSLMRALMLDPQLLLLDEPLGALDPLIRGGLQEELRGIFRELHKTVLIVTHDLPEAAYLGDEVLLMKAGRPIQRGTLSELRDEPATPFVKEFVDTTLRTLQRDGAQ